MMKVRFDLDQRKERRENRRDKELFKAIMASLSLADRVGNGKCRALLARALQEA